MNIQSEQESSKTCNIAIFASGSGSNAENIIEHFKFNSGIRVKLILTNNEKAGVIDRAKRLNIPFIAFNRTDFYDSQKILDTLKSENINFIILAGFLWLFPANIIQNYNKKVVNIHPALLPKFGGKGMYGSLVHKKVIEMGEQESGITIHYVNEKYDEGNIIFQAKCNINKEDSPEILAEKIHNLEYEHFPKVIEDIITGLKS